MISPLDSKVLDINSEYLDVSVEALMHNAGSALAETVTDMFPGRRVLYICGHGNNGGDGYVAVRISKSDCAYLKPPKTDLCKVQSQSVKAVPYDKELLNGYDVIVDCVLGTGVSGKLRDPFVGYVEDINSSGKIIVSCDVPTGFGTDMMVRPDVTVTFHDMKEGMDESNCGTIVVADIGIPDDACRYVGPGDMLRYPIPKVDSHKGQNGRLLIIGGGPYIGAPAMAALAALRIGCDLVHIATPASSFAQISAFSPAFIMHRIQGDVLSADSADMLLSLSEDVDAVLIGPGLGTSEDTQKAVRDFVKRCARPLVIDADGITAMAGSGIKKDTIYTPHHSEYRRLGGDSAPEKTAKDLGSVIVLKGREDLITDGERTRVNRTGSPGMTVGGTGDVLAGAIAGLLSKGMSSFDSGCLGAYICGRAGELSFDELSYGMMPTDVIDNIGRVLRKELP